MHFATQFYLLAHGRAQLEYSNQIAKVSIEAKC